MSRRTEPPFRADMVGSLLRTAPLKEARARHAAGEIDADALRAVEDEEIRAIVKKQAEIGLQAVTDGEFRRSWWHFDFLWGLDGVAKVEKAIQFQGRTTKAENVAVTGRIGFDADHPMIGHFRFLAGATDRVAKMTIPSPSVLHFRGGRESISREIYPDLDEFFDDLALTYRKIVAGFYAAGCRYLQFDDTVFSYLCDPEQLEQARARGDEPEGLASIYAKTISKALEGRPDDLRVTMHSCRGNFRSTWISQGGYEPVAEILFNEADIDAYFLEYDTDRAGGFEPLRFLPKHKQAVLGLVTSKSGTLEARDDIRRRIEEATAFADVDQLCLSPQCGFASTEEGNILAEEEQWQKLAMIVELADTIWK
ncbi:MAG: 5-methyltetrahydropteroyltriglutamate--homocysteine S-methyltransferase [Geminicoccaceae bacterium]